MKIVGTSKIFERVEGGFICLMGIHEGQRVLVISEIPTFELFADPPEYIRIESSNAFLSPDVTYAQAFAKALRTLDKASEFQTKEYRVHIQYNDDGTFWFVSLVQGREETCVLPFVKEDIDMGIHLEVADWLESHAQWCR